MNGVEWKDAPQRDLSDDELVEMFREALKKAREKDRCGVVFVAGLKTVDELTSTDTVLQTGPYFEATGDNMILALTMYTSMASWIEEWDKKNMLPKSHFQILHPMLHDVIYPIIEVLMERAKKFKKHKAAEGEGPSSSN